MKIRRIVLLILFLSFALSNKGDATERIDLPASVYYYRAPASVFGPEALWNNPAALSEYKSRSLQFIGELEDGYIARSWGVVSNEKSFAVAHRSLYLPDETDIRQYLAGVGFPLGKYLAFGASYGKFTHGPSLLNDHSIWTTGSLVRMGDNLTLAAVATNLNRIEVGGIKSKIEWQFSAASRTKNGRLTTSATAFVSSDMSNEKPHWIFTGEYVAAKGITIEGSVETDRSWQLGARLNLEHYFFGGITRVAKNGDGRGTTIYSGWTEKRQETSFPSKPRRVTHRMQGRVSENPVQPVFGSKRLPFLVQLHAIYRAADDPSVAELHLGFDGASFGFAQAQELRDAIRYFRSRGKYVTCHLKAAGNVAYYVASSANRIIMSPHDQLNLTGLKAEVTYWAGTLEKIGVKAEIVRIGDYKTAMEPYTQHGPTPAASEQMNRLLDNLYNQLVSGIASGRQMTDSATRATIDRGPFTTEDAISAKLVDAEGRWEQLHEKRMLFDRPEISLREYVSDSLIVDTWTPSEKIAVVVVDGEIMPDKGTGLPFQSDDAATPSLVRRGLAQALHDPSVSGIVLRIDSPGGFATSADDMLFYIQEAKRFRPLVVSMGNTAASGGYAIATATDRIFTNSGTITGSIGIFGGKADLSKLDEKIGVHRELYTRGAHAGYLTLSRPWTEAEMEKYHSLLRSSYDQFVASVSACRNLTVDSVDHLGQGRVWTGSEAISIGLASAEGGLIQAIAECAELANSHEYSVAVYPKKRTLFSFSPRGVLSGFIRQTSKLLGLGEETNVSSVAVPDGSIMARLPYDISIE